MSKPLAPKLAEGTVLQGTYRVMSVLGQGGVGEVYLANHVRLPKRAAVKVLRPEYAHDEEALARFRREAELTSEIGHHHIVEVLDFNHTPDGLHYIVMEFLQGEDLANLLDHTQLDLGAIESIVTQTADAIGAAHERGIVHRDLKPHNIFICPRSDAPHFVKVLDFGISKVKGSKSALTMPTTTVGTPMYMSPEQALGKADLDGRTDQFALGSILYEMLTRQPAFAAEEVTATLFRVVHDEPTPVRALSPWVPPAVEAVVKKALRKAPEERFASMAELASALREACSGQPRGQSVDSQPTAPIVKSGPTTLSVATGQMLSADETPEVPGSVAALPTVSLPRLAPVLTPGSAGQAPAQLVAPSMLAAPRAAARMKWLMAGVGVLALGVGLLVWRLVAQPPGGAKSAGAGAGAAGGGVGAAGGGAGAAGAAAGGAAKPGAPAGAGGVVVAPLVTPLADAGVAAAAAARDAALAAASPEPVASRKRPSKKQPVVTQAPEPSPSPSSAGKKPRKVPGALGGGLD